MKKNGFTLVELFVAIAIIAILTSILFPVFARARENARRSSCASNMRQLGLGFQQYTQDYDERLPNVAKGAVAEGLTGGWIFFSTFDAAGKTSVFDVTRGGLYPYVKSAQIYICPSDTVGRVEGDSYATGPCTDDNASPIASGKGLAYFDYPSESVMLAEHQIGSTDSSTDDGSGFTDLGGKWNTGDRHLGTINVAFVDGHVKAFRPEKLYADALMYGGHGRAACP